MSGKDDIEYIDPDDVLETFEVGGGTGGGGGDDSSSDGELADEDVEDRAVEDEEDAIREPKGPDNWFQQADCHSSSVFCIAVSPNGALAASGGGDDVAYIFDVASGAVKHKLTGHTDTVNALAFNYTGDLLATGGLDAVVRVWNVATGAQVLVIEGSLSGEVEWLAWHAKGDVLLAGSADGTAWMWHVKRKNTAAAAAPAAPAAAGGASADAGAAAAPPPTFTCTADVMAVLAGHEGSVMCGTFTGNGKAIVTGGDDGSIRCWNPRDSTCTFLIEEGPAAKGHEDVINCIAAAPDKPLVMTGSQDGTARLTNIATGKVVGVLRHGAHGTGAAGGAAAGSGVTVVRDGEEEGDEGHPSVESVAFCPTHPWAASGATDGSVIVWNLDTLAPRVRLEVDDAVIKVAWVTAPPTLPAAAPAAAIAATSVAPAAPSTAAAAAPLAPAPLLLVSTADGEVVVFDGRTGKQLYSLTGHAGMVLEFAVVPVGAPASPVGAPALPWVVTAGDDSMCNVYCLPPRAVAAVLVAATAAAGAAAPAASTADAPATAAAAPAAAADAASAATTSTA